MRHPIPGGRVHARALCWALSCVLALPCLSACGGRSDASPADAQRPLSRATAAVSGLWADSTGSYLLANRGQRWYCSTRGWLYLSPSLSSGSASSGPIACTTPVGNDIGWAGGTLSNVTVSGNQVSFDRSAGVFGASTTTCHITATLSGNGLRGTQRCVLTYTDPFGMTGHAEATVQGPYGAERVTAFGPALASVGCGREHTLTSQGLAAGTMVWFQNRSSQPLTIFLLDRKGQRGGGTSLPANGTVVQPAPVSTPLLLVDARGSCRGMYVTTSQPTTVIVP